MVGDHAGKTIQPCAADHTPVDTGSPVFAVEHKECPKAGHAKEIQLAEVQDERSFQLRITADRVAQQVCIRCVYFTVHAQDGCQATRVHMELRPSAIDQMTAAWLPTKICWISKR